MDFVDFDSLSNRDIGRVFLNLYYYRKSRAEMTDPSVVDLALDIEKAITDARLNERESDIIRVHYDIMGGDAITGDREDKQQQTANYLGIHVNTVGNNLKNVWERIGRSYRGVKR